VSKKSKAYNCSKCGASFAPHEQCRDLFDLCLAKEFQDPEAFGAVHHLTVLCYMMQHNEYSSASWLGARKMLAQFIRQGVNPSTMRQQMRDQMDSGKRKQSITRGPKLVAVGSVKWTRTIANVRLDDAQTYCADVRQWAESVLQDGETINP
jgi:hypothetical protein